MLSLDGVADMAKQNFAEKLAESGVMAAAEFFGLIDRPVAYRTVARSTSSELLEAIPQLFVSLKNEIEFVTLGDGLDAWIEYDKQLPAHKSFRFLRSTRRLKEKNDPACFDGHCLEKNILNGKLGIFSREIY